MDLIWNGKRLLVPGGGLHIGWVEPAPIQLLDKVGNAYTTVTIGTQEWTVQNLRTTKYADGTNIPNITANSVPNLFSGWTNTSWDTFTSSGLNITSAIKSAGITGYARTEEEPFVTGNHLHIIFTITLNSGSLPTINIIRNGSQWATYGTSAGFNYIDYTIPGNDNYAVEIKSNTSGTNISATIQISAVADFGWVEDRIGAYCWYNNSSSTGNTYGALYNWHAVNNAHGLVYFEKGGVQELGWRVPTTTDIATLVDYISDISTVGGYLKATGTTYWDSPNTNATDSYGFMALGSGYRHANDGSFNGIKTFFYTWTSTSYDTNNAWNEYLWYNDAGIHEWYNKKEFGLVVRCVRDVV